MDKPTRTWVDVNPETENHYVFYNHRKNGSNIIIIPKQTDWETFQLTETPTTYILTVTPTNTDKTTEAWNEDVDVVGSDCMCVLGSEEHRPECEYYITKDN